MSGVRVWERYVTARIAYLVPTCTYKYQGTSKSKHVTIVNLCSVLCPLFHREWRIKPCVDCAHFLVVNLDVRRCHPAILVSFVILWSEVLNMWLYDIIWDSLMEDLPSLWHSVSFTYFLAKTRMVCTMILAGEGCIYWIDHERFIQLTKLRGSRSTLHLHFIWIMYVVVFDCHPGPHGRKKPDGHSTSFSFVQLGMTIQIFPEHRIDHWSITMLFNLRNMFWRFGNPNAETL